MKYLVLVATLIVIGASVMLLNVTNAQTKIPYNNGFYAGPYNPKLVIINPNKTNL